MSSIYNRLKEARERLAKEVVGDTWVKEFKALVRDVQRQFDARTAAYESVEHLQTLAHMHDLLQDLRQAEFSPAKKGQLDMICVCVDATSIRANYLRGSCVVSRDVPVELSFLRVCRSLGEADVRKPEREAREQAFQALIDWAKPLCKDELSCADITQAPAFPETSFLLHVLLPPKLFALVRGWVS